MALGPGQSQPRDEIIDKSGAEPPPVHVASGMHGGNERAELQGSAAKMRGRSDRIVDIRCPKEAGVEGRGE